ncbi:unnamed protein product [Pelagomonas calceolata]|uniref:USP domain-containing protein n=2 Tax=Pelagomonas calceolata TaxID=35677 RepID=A0A8J2SN37_9STRA|nr:unnamed protein product [Pelagomonas calceolata]
MSSRSAADALRALSLGPASSQATADAKITVGARIAMTRLVPDESDLRNARANRASAARSQVAAIARRAALARAVEFGAADTCVGVVEGIDGERVVVRLDCGLRVIIGAESVSSRSVDSDDAPPVGAFVELQGLASAAFNGRRGVVTATPPDVAAVGRVAVVIDGRSIAIKRANVIFASDAVVDASSDVWFREEAWVNILPFLDARALARFVLASRRADVRRWAEAHVERTVAAVAVRAPTLLATRHEAVPLIQWLATTVEPQLAGDFAPRPLPLDRRGDCMVSLFCLFAACPLESFLRAEGCLGRDVGVYAALEAYVNRTGGPDGPDGARVLLTTLRQVLMESHSNFPAEGQPGDAMDVFADILSHFDDILARIPCDRPVTLASSHYDADDAGAVLRAAQSQVGPMPPGVLYAELASYERRVTKDETGDFDVVELNCFLRLQPRGGASLYDMIDAAIAPEQFGGASNGTLQRTIWCTGRVLVFNLILYQWDGATQRTRFNAALLDDPISFPVEGLDMTRYVHRPAASEVFDLVGAVLFLSYGNGGHYVAVTYHELSRCWFLFDDDTVERLDSLEAYVAEEGAVPTILFYRRRPAAARPLK